MVVVIVENAPQKLRGRLKLWMMEVGTCVYVTDCNSKMRTWLWDTVQNNIGRGSATIIWATSKSEFGFDFNVCGNNDFDIDVIDGIKFMIRTVID